MYRQDVVYLTEYSVTPPRSDTPHRIARGGAAAPPAAALSTTRGPLAATPRDGTWVVFEAGPNPTEDVCGRYTPGSPGARLQDTSEPTPTGRGGRFVSRPQPRVMGRGFEAGPPTEDGVAVGTDPAPGRARLQDIRGRHRPLGGIPPA